MKPAQKLGTESVTMSGRAGVVLRWLVTAALVFGLCAIGQADNQTRKPTRGGSSLPTQTGNSGKFLTTDGTNASWGTVSIPAGGDKSWDIPSAIQGCYDSGVNTSDESLICDLVSTFPGGGLGGTGGVTRGVMIAPGQNMTITGGKYYAQKTIAHNMRIALWDRRTGSKLGSCDVAVTTRGMYSCAFSSPVSVYGGKSYYVTEYDPTNTDSFYVNAAPGTPLSYPGSVTTAAANTIGPFLLFHPSVVCTSANTDCVPTSKESTRIAPVWPTYTVP